MRAALLLLLAVGLGSSGVGVARAQTDPVAAVIADSAGANAAGRIAINQAAGAGNVQANLAAISTGDADVASSQRIAHAAAGLSASSRLADQAFNGASGLVSINQASGAANAQVNVAVVAPSASVALVSNVSQARNSPGPVNQIEQLGDSVLSGVAAQGRRPEAAQAPGARQDASIASTALRNTSGVVQVNQTAGTGNVTSNVFVLRPPAGTFF